MFTQYLYRKIAVVLIFFVSSLCLFHMSISGPPNGKDPQNPFNPFDAPSSQVRVNLPKLRPRRPPNNTGMHVKGLLQAQKNLNNNDFKHILRDISAHMTAMKQGYEEEVGCWTCQRYNITTNISHLDYPCVDMPVKPPAVLCLYPYELDGVVSRAYYRNGSWEKAQFDVLRDWVSTDPDIGFIDIGAYIGTYTLPIAAMGHRVLAVEPNRDSVHRLHKAVVLGNLSDRVTILANAISNQRLPTKLIRPKKNQAGTWSRTVERNPSINFDNNDHAKSIYLDDILPYCDFAVGILKIDIVGFEHRAFRRADILFDNIYIPYIQMEWRAVKAAGRSDKEEEDYRLFMYMLDFFKRRHYVPRTITHGHKELDMGVWRHWPNDIAWTKF